MKCRLNTMKHDEYDEMLMNHDEMLSSVPETRRLAIDTLKSYLQRPSSVTQSITFKNCKILE